MFLLGVPFDFVILFDQRLEIEAVCVVVLRSGSVYTYAAVVVLQASHHNVEKSVLIDLGECSGFFRNLSSEELVG